MIQRNTRMLMVAAAAFVGGCSLMPEYQRPESPVPAQWPQGPAYVETADDQPGQSSGGLKVDQTGWREFFVDPVLRALIERAFENSPDARIAALQVEQVRARYQLQNAELWPQIEAQASYTRQKTPSRFGGTTTGAGGGAGAGGTGQGSSFNSAGGEFEYYRAGVGLTAYELDLFGRVRSLEDQALSQYVASIQARRAAQISLVAQVANAYLQWQADYAQLQLAEKTLDAQSESVDLIGKRMKVGVASELELRQAQTALETARADRARYRRLAARDRNALTALVGAPVPRRLLRQQSLDDPKLAGVLNVPMDSSLLLRRPDVLAAEYDLKAANANIGAARAAFFPRISLLGSYGSISTELDGLFDAGTTAWSFTPQISLPIFDGGRNDANLDVAEVSKRIEVARYRKTVQTAFRETADALAGRSTLNDELAARDAMVAAAESGFELADKRYRQGVDSYLPVLDALRELYRAEQSRIAIQAAEVANRVALYKALGGGWRETGEQTPGGPRASAEDEAEEASGLRFFDRLSPL